ncbi:MAG: ELM1/GtrOC1 family putative glycosyltransferase [bacterium]
MSAVARKRKRRVLIISDGKRGHVHQTEGIVSRMTNVVAKKAEVRMGKAYCFFLVFVAILSRLMPISRAVLWLFLSRAVRASLPALVKFSPDLIISAGSLTHPVTYLLGRIWNARTVVCMRPSLLSASDFDLVVAPRHDQHRCGADNVIFTMGATSTITEGHIFAEGVALYSRLKGRVTRPLGLLVGGDSACNFLDVHTAKEIINETLLACEENGLTLLCCSSRRTPPAVETLMLEALEDNPLCAYLLLASRSPENPVPGIIGLSEVVVCTEDSVSMVSEIITGGRSAVVVETGKRRKDNKFERFFRELVSEDYIIYTKPEFLSRAVAEAFEGKKGGAKPVDETKRVAMEIERRLFAADGGTGVRH